MNLCKSNFDFVYENYDDSITAPLKEAEKTFWTDYITAGVALRKVLEGWCKRTMEAHKIIVGPKPSLVDKIEAIRQYHPVDMQKKEYKYIIKGQEEPHNLKIWHYVWRGYGNVCSHDEDLKPDYPSACFENLVVVFNIVYDFFYADATEKGYNIANSISNCFDARKLAIVNNMVVLERKRADSLCEHEFVTISYSEAGTVENYGIVRIFEKEKLRHNIQNIEVQTNEYEIYLNKIKNLKLAFSCCNDAEVLSGMSSSHSDFYIVKYKFNQIPCSLNKTLSQKLPLERKIKLCKDIAVQLNEYHKVGVFHRNLNYNSIAICEDDKGDLRPAIIKLEYAKSINSSYTALPRWKERVTEERSLLKYEDRHLAVLTQEPTSEDWKKADIFSLGVLFGDILTENLSLHKPASITDMNNSRVPKEIQNTVCYMSAKSPKQRPEISAAIDLFDQFLSKQKGEE